jgi:hypothetical protein
VSRVVLAPLAVVVLASALAGAPSRAALPASAAVNAAGSTSAAASASAPAPHGSSAPVAARPVLGAELGREPSPPPTVEEWRGGRAVAPTRGSAGRCALTLVREWLRVRCPGAPGAGLVAGETRGVTVRTVGRAFSETGEPGDLVSTVVLPLRREQSLVVSFNDLAFEYDSTALVEGGMLSVVWRSGRADPVLAMYGFPTAPPKPVAGVGPE